jgi:FkbM family methyltransferase
MADLIRSAFQLALRFAGREFKAGLLCELARELGIASLRCDDGDLGPFEGLTRDEVVFQSYLGRRTWAPEVQAVLQTLLRKGGTLVDAGANIGLTSIPIASKHAGVSCYAFEPEPTNFELLTRNIASNAVESRVRPVPLALLDHEGSVQFRLSSSNMGDHRVQITDEQVHVSTEPPTVQVKTVRLDTYFAGVELVRPIVLKLDTQGAEVRVLAGAERLLADVDYVIAEYWPDGLRRFGDSPDEYLRAVSAFPFGAVLPRNGQLPRLVAIGEVVRQARAIEQTRVDGRPVREIDLLLSRVPMI